MVAEPLEMGGHHHLTPVDHLEHQESDLVHKCDQESVGMERQAEKCNVTEQETALQLYVLV